MAVCSRVYSILISQPCARRICSGVRAAQIGERPAGGLRQRVKKVKWDWDLIRSALSLATGKD